MIQRIQTIFLLLTAILMAVTVYSPLALLSQSAVFQSLGIYTEPAAPAYISWGVISLASLTAVLSLINIFLYKKRKLQMKLCHLITFMIVMFYIAFVVYLQTGMAALHLSFVRPSYGLVLPAVALVLNVLAFLRIRGDERLIQSMNRIR